ncbi:hypothetical protein AA0472_1222 [Acetobacter estunensis NRIC 0472]|uniref:Uncharacterized protein n=1 Tax=Acetobacter estunensis TaxID=104097 RepID=A0A967ECF3_9PROT|nr:hypothetical protein [Acetobacter estunensis]NHO53211.1 hypothetical protein [Acetobacter estunensis]GBQ23800.1 hypothetical protein AA0472_1222 [Acetobacter estunensis NRIC 0472]
MSDTVQSPQLSPSDLANNERAIAYYNEHGCGTVEAAFHLANILHTDRCVAEAARVYHIGYELHSKSPDQHPGAHILLHVSLLCQLKAGLPLSDEDMEALKGLSIPLYNYIAGIRTAWNTGDLVKATRMMGNCYDEFHTGEECDRLYLEVVNRLYQEQMHNGVADARVPSTLIPRKIYMYWDNETPEEVERNFEYHRSLKGLEVKTFNQAEAAQWLYEVYGVEARNLFMGMRHPAEAADFLRVHVIQALGGWWLDADIRIRSEEVFFGRLSQHHSHVFLLTHDCVVHNDFFGSVANSPILGDVLLSLYRNCYLFPSLYIPYKTGPGPFERGLNRTFHADFNRTRALPSMITYDNHVFSEVIEELHVEYKFQGKSWHGVSN